MAQPRKRISKAFQDDYWDCSVCTLRNSPDDFKCSACNVRKGTSTRKPRLNQQIVDQQEATRLVTMSQMSIPSSMPAPNLPGTGSKQSKDDPSDPDKPAPLHKTLKRVRCHIPGINRGSADEYKITVNDRTVIFMEFKPKRDDYL